MPPVPADRRPAVTIAVLAVTQLIGWGTTFDMLGVMGRIIAPDLKLANEVIFLGISVMMLVSAVAGPATGRLLNRFGARNVLAAGSVVFFLGLLALSAAQGLIGYMLAWAIIGLGGAFGLSSPAYTAIVEREGLRAGRVIAILMLFTGLSSAIFWPLLDVVQAHIGWRMTFVATAFIHLCVCLPLHLFALPRPGGTATADEGHDIAPIALSDRQRLAAFLLIAVSTMLATFVTYGLTPSLLHILSLSGASPSLALELGSLRGVMGIAARFLDMLLGRRSSPLIGTTAGILMLVVSFAMLAFAGDAPPLLVGFVVLYGFGTGVITVARALLPLLVFSRREFGMQSARLSLPQNLASAVAPVVFTGILDRLGLDAVIVTITALSILSLLLTLALWIVIRRAKAIPAEA